MADNRLKSQAFKLKGRLYTFTVLQILSANVSEITHQLQEVMAKAPKFLQGSPIVLDFSNAPNQLDCRALIQALRDFCLVPVAIQGASSEIVNEALILGLPSLNASTAHDKPLYEMSENPEKFDAPEILKGLNSTKLITSPVRSGQQCVSKGADLIVASSVGHGAELLADGHIHVYGTLRGRALAGMSGDKTARIFCHSLEAELVSIAGFYRLSDAIEPMSGPCQIYLKDEHIQIESL